MDLYSKHQYWAWKQKRCISISQKYFNVKSKRGSSWIQNLRIIRENISGPNIKILIIKVAWTDHITKMEFIRRIGKQKEIAFTIKQQKLEYLGHIMRHEKYRLLQLVIQGEIDSKRDPGRRRHSWLHNLRQWLGLLNYSEIQRTRSELPC